MHGYSRLGNGKPNGGTPPSSGSSSPRLRAGKGGKGGGFGGTTKPEKLAQRLVYLLLSAVFRRKGVLLFAPVLYIAGMLMYMGTLNLDAVQEGVGVAILRRPPVGSVYRSPKVFENLWPFMQADGGNSSLALMTAWHTKEGQRWMPCVRQTVYQTGLPPSNGFLIIEANGGLNQQRLSICDAVAVAGLLNATLVIPMFHLNSVWRDSSKFGEIFDEDYFIDTLKSHVRVVKELPEDVFQRFDNNMSNIVNLRVKAWSSKTYYMQKVLPRLLEFGYRFLPYPWMVSYFMPSVPRAFIYLIYRWK